MKVLGVNGAWAQPAASGAERHGLADGSAALVTDGRVACAAIEERLSRCRYSGGYQLGARACLEAERLAWWELDAVGFSTCCDTKWDSSADVLEDLSESLGRPPAGVRTRPAVVVVDHHLSHASLAFATSGFENALVAVLDGSGNRLGPRVGEGWWEAPFQRQSFYRAAWRSGRLHLEFLEADGMAPHDLGVGGAWRAVTHYLGWPSYQQAGKTMALAAFGDPTRFRNVPLVGLDGAGLLTSGLSGRHDDPIGTVAALFQRSGISLSAPPGTPWPRHPIGDAVDLAAALQRQTEDALVSRIEGLCDREGVRNVCLSGG